MEANSLASGRTPLQKTSTIIQRNGQLYYEMLALKNVMHGLSKETRDAWQVFADLFWNDHKFLRDQKDLYKTENKELLAAITKNNAAIATHQYIERKKEFAKTLKKAEPICGRCKDVGFTDQVYIGEKLRIAFCKCPAGIALYRQGWLRSQDGQHYACSYCSMVFEKIQKHTCSGPAGAYL